MSDKKFAPMLPFHLLNSLLIIIFLQCESGEPRLEEMLLKSSYVPCNLLCFLSKRLFIIFYIETFSGLKAPNVKKKQWSSCDPLEYILQY